MEIKNKGLGEIILGISAYSCLLFLLMSAFSFAFYPSLNKILGKIFIYSLIFGGLFIGLPIILFLTGKEIIKTIIPYCNFETIKNTGKLIMQILGIIMLFVIGGAIIYGISSSINSLSVHSLLVLIVIILFFK